MAKYFFGMDFPDKGWSQFGHEVEGYITAREYSGKFSETEKTLLNTIEPLGVYQEEIFIDFGDFVLQGFIDDRLLNWMKIRDYKTASLSSSKQYSKKDYQQMNVYAIKAFDEIGEIPEIEICIIERTGNCSFTGGRDVLKVGNNVSYLKLKPTIQELDDLRKDIRVVAKEISDYYEIYLQFNK
jgi:hypothetical protein